MLAKEKKKILVSQRHLLAICFGLILAVDMVSSINSIKWRDRLGLTKQISDEAKENHPENVILKLHQAGIDLYRRSRDDSETKEILKEKLNAILGDEGPSYLLKFKVSFENFKKEIKENEIKGLLSLLALHNDEEIDKELEKYDESNKNGDIILLGKLYKFSLKILEEGANLSIKNSMNIRSMGEGMEQLIEKREWMALDVFNDGEGDKFKEAFQRFFETSVKYEQMLGSQFNSFGDEADLMYKKLENVFNFHKKQLIGIEENGHNEHTLEKAKSIIFELENEGKLSALKEMLPLKGQSNREYRSDAKLIVPSLVKEEFYGKILELQIEVDELKKRVNMLKRNKVEYEEYIQVANNRLESYGKDIEARVNDVAGFAQNSHNEHTLKTANQIASDLEKNFEALKESSIPMHVQSDSDDIVAVVLEAKKSFNNGSENLSDKLEELDAIIGLLKKDKKIDDDIQRVKEAFHGQHGKHIPEGAEESAISALLQEELAQAEREKLALDDTKVKLMAEKKEKESEMHDLKRVKKQLDKASTKISSTKEQFDKEFAGADGKLLEITGALGNARDAIADAIKEQQEKIINVEIEIVNLKEDLRTKEKELIDLNVHEIEVRGALREKNQVDEQVENLMKVRRNLHSSFQPNLPSDSEKHILLILKNTQPSDSEKVVDSEAKMDLTMQREQIQTKTKKQRPRNKGKMVKEETKN